MNLTDWMAMTLAVLTDEAQCESAIFDAVYSPLLGDKDTAQRLVSESLAALCYMDRALQCGSNRYQARQAPQNDQLY